MRLRGSHIALAAAFLFFLSGQPFIPLLGVEADEALFAMVSLPPLYAAGVRIGHHTIPLMIMTYLGALKGWIYTPILRWFRPSVWTLREPMLVAGALSIWLFYLLLKRTCGERAAVIGSVLLATDSLYLLTTCFDWGPVALQHLLLIGGMYLMVRFYQERRLRMLAGGGFLLGLVLWDKAVAAWMLSGLAIAVLALFWREVRSLFDWRRMAVLAGAFIAGALPLWTYNLAYDWATFRGNFHSDFHEFRGKAEVLQATLHGEVLFGYLAMEQPAAALPHQPGRGWQRVSARLAEVAGYPRHSLLIYAVAGAMLLAPLSGPAGRRAAVFVLIASAVAWSQMAITAGAGGSPHHVILMWPLPHLVFAAVVAGAAKSRRSGMAAAAAVTIVLAGSGMLLTNTYYQKMLRNGASQSWNDAIVPLSQYLETLPSTYVFCMDWGMVEPIRYLSGGKLPVAGSDDRFTKPGLTAQELAVVEQVLADSSNLYVARTADTQFFPRNTAFLERAAGLRYRQRVLGVIPDSFGRPIFEVYRLGRVSE